VAKQFTLGKQERLKSRKRIEELFKNGNRFTLPSLSVLYQFSESPTSVIQFGLGVSSRNFKKAVDRNRIKRQMKEAWRLQILPLKEKTIAVNLQLFVFVNFIGHQIPDYKEIYAQVGSMISRLGNTKQINK